MTKLRIRSRKGHLGHCESVHYTNLVPLTNPREIEIQARL